MYKNVRLTEKAKEALDLILLEDNFRSISDCIVWLCKSLQDKKEMDSLQDKKKMLMKDIESLKYTIILAEDKYKTVFEAKEKLQKEYLVLLQNKANLK
jgi:deoxyxylulose-5-phosphate synthase